MLKSKVEKTVEILAGPGETVSGARIIAFESGVRLVTGDIDRSGRHYEPLCTTFWESHKARQIAYALLLAADASDHARSDIDEIKRREVDRENRKATLETEIETAQRIYGWDATQAVSTSLINAMGAEGLKDLHLYLTTGSDISADTRAGLKKLAEDICTRDYTPPQKILPAIVGEVEAGAYERTDGLQTLRD